MRLLGQIRRILDKLLESVVIASVMALVGVVLWGVVTRFLLDSPSRWTEEVAKFLLMWVALLGAPVAHGRREHLGFDYLASMLHPDARRWMEVAAEMVVIWGSTISRVCSTRTHAAGWSVAAEMVVIAFASVVMIFGGYLLMAETLAVNQVTPALGMRMGYVYAVVPISGFFIVFYSLHHLFQLVSNDPREDAVDKLKSQPDAQ